MKGYCILRLTPETVLLEDAQRQRLEITPDRLPSGSREGDWILLGEDGSVSPDPEETQRRRSLNRRLLDGLLGKNK
ncbi:DUF3006 family protein [Oscillospiraceae bacterium MB08-C2-2]|nr:DUF3006 family protein [Oscillospiraceae bacterium MB08-C2-2]